MVLLPSGTARRTAVQSTVVGAASTPSGRQGAALGRGRPPWCTVSVEAAWMWARTDMWRRRASLLALALLVALALGSTLAFVAGARRAGSAVDRFEQATDSPEVQIFSSGPPSDDLPRAIHDSSLVAGVETTDAAVVVPAPLLESGGGAIVAVARGDNPGVIGRPMLIEGRYPAPGATDELMLSERSAHDSRLHAGDRVPLSSIACVATCPQKPDGEAEVVGVVRLPPDPPHDPSTGGLALAGPSFLGGRWRSALQVGTLSWLHLHDPADT